MTKIHKRPSRRLAPKVARNEPWVFKDGDGIFKGGYNLPWSFHLKSVWMQPEIGKFCFVGFRLVNYKLGY